MRPRNNNVTTTTTRRGRERATIATTIISGAAAAAGAVRSTPLAIISTPGATVGQSDAVSYSLAAQDNHALAWRGTASQLTTPAIKTPRRTRRKKIRSAVCLVSCRQKWQCLTSDLNFLQFAFLSFFLCDWEILRSNLHFVQLHRKTIYRGTTGE